MPPVLPAFLSAARAVQAWLRSLPGRLCARVRFLKSDASPLFLWGLVVLGVMFAVSLPEPLFSSYYSPALYDRNGKLLGAMAAFDGQWRFPAQHGKGAVNEKFALALIEAEDKRFRNHTGIDFFALGRALIQNLRSGKIISGASTITMQTIRLSRPGSRRTILGKAVEAVLAMRLELACSKDEILALYTAHAPFGANVVGIEAASWRWFGRSSAELSWAEAAALAVLPNSPGLIHPGRNRAALREKRDALLVRLHTRGLFDGETLALAMTEELPGEPEPLTGIAPHLLARIVTEAGGLAAFNSANFSHPLYANNFSLLTTIDYEIQERVKTILDRRAERFAAQGIMNGAYIVLDSATGETLAYLGNTTTKQAPDVDIAASPRSSGSLFKPFLFAAMLDTGGILPESLISDIPTRAGSYSPQNSSRTYLGVVPAGAALARSLNVPAVRSLRVYGVERFAALLRTLGVSSLFRKGEDYGLPLILGGAEVSLWEITGLYAGLARTALGDNPAFYPPRFFPAEEAARGTDLPPLSQGAAWLTLEALTFVTRPGEEAYWQEYAGARRIAWKTGTSYGSRDAWAVGITPERTVGVWIGNASGEGRAELSSISASAPVLFEVFSALESIKRSGEAWFPQPAAALKPVEVCARSGFPAGPDCSGVRDAFVPVNAPDASGCPYCKTVALNEEGTARITLGTGMDDGMERAVLRTWFVLPPAEEWFYRIWNLEYRPLPPFAGEAGAGPSIAGIALLNPEENSAVYVPRELDGREGRIVFQAASRRSEEKIYWHLDDVYLGMTETFHDMEARPAPGRHTLTLVGSTGETVRRAFEVLGSAE